MLVRSFVTGLYFLGSNVVFVKHRAFYHKISLLSGKSQGRRPTFKESLHGTVSFEFLSSLSVLYSLLTTAMAAHFHPTYLPHWVQAHFPESLLARPQAFALSTAILMFFLLCENAYASTCIKAGMPLPQFCTHIFENTVLHIR